MGKLALLVTLALLLPVTALGRRPPEEGVVLQAKGYLEGNNILNNLTRQYERNTDPAYLGDILVAVAEVHRRIPKGVVIDGKPDPALIARIESLERWRESAPSTIRLKDFTQVEDAVQQRFLDQRSELLRAADSIAAAGDGRLRRQIESSISGGDGEVWRPGPGALAAGGGMIALSLLLLLIPVGK